MTANSARITLMKYFGVGIASLPPHIRETVCYRCAGYSNSEIASIQQIAYATVSYRLKKARSRSPLLEGLFLLLREVPTRTTEKTLRCTVPRTPPVPAPPVLTNTQ